MVDKIEAGQSGPGVEFVLTYNFDDIFERYLCAADVQHRPLVADDSASDEDELAVHHVHGFIPEEPGNRGDSGDELVVFSEERYHKLFLEPYVDSNLVQINAFRQNVCLFVGTSMTDPNLRRLLEMAARSVESPGHFVFLRRINTPDVPAVEESCAVPDYLLDGFLAAHHDLQERALAELGVKVLWVESYDEEPSLIDSIHSGPVASD